ncbi:MAG: hypothetical protein GXX86_12670 [Propionibacterium sp.]|nr:hypothetical protein [Propionibacterium sp.]
MALFNTDSLRAPLTKDELTTLKRRRRDGEFGPVQNELFAMAIFVAVAFFAILFTLGNLSRISRSGTSIPFLVPMVVLIVLLGSLVYRRFGSDSHAAWAKIARFAEANGLSYRHRSTNPSYPGLIFGLGSDRASHHHVLGSTGAFADAGRYTYVTGSGKNRSTHTWHFAAFRLPRPMPHLLLDAKSNNMLGSNLPISLRRDQRVSLGSPFDDHYTLYAPNSYESDAFFLFPPNVMEALLDATSDYDIEIVDDWMLLYTRSHQDLADPRTWELFETIDESVVDGLSRVSQRYTDRRAQASSATPGEPARAIAAEGQRLARSPMKVLVSMGVMVGVWLLMRFVIF